MLVTEISGVPLTTLAHTCGDTAETLGDVTDFLFQITNTPGLNVEKRNVTRVIITCESYPIRYAWEEDPTQAGLGHILSPGQGLVLTNFSQISRFTFINHTNGSNAILQITPEV